MSDVQTLLNQLSAEVNAQIRTNKKGERQCALCGRRGTTDAEIEHTEICNQPTLVRLVAQLRDAIG